MRFILLTFEDIANIPRAVAVMNVRTPKIFENINVVIVRSSKIIIDSF